MKNKFLFLFFISFSPLFITSSYAFGNNYTEFEESEDDETSGIVGFVKRHKIFTSLSAVAACAGIVVYNNENLWNSVLSTTSSWFSQDAQPIEPSNDKPSTNQPVDDKKTNNENYNPVLTPIKTKKNTVSPEAQFKFSQLPYQEASEGLKKVIELCNNLQSFYDSNSNNGPVTWDMTFESIDDMKFQVKKLFKSNKDMLFENEDFTTVTKSIQALDNLKKDYSNGKKNIPDDNQEKLRIIREVFQPLFNKINKHAPLAFQVYSEVTKQELTYKRNYIGPVPLLKQKELVSLIVGGLIAAIAMFKYGGK